MISPRAFRCLFYASLPVLGVSMIGGLAYELAAHHRWPGFGIDPHWYGDTLLAANDYEKALKEYRMAARISPDAGARAKLALTLNRAGEFEAPAEARIKRQEAAEQLETALQMSPDSAELHSVLAGILADLGRMNEAETHCRRALALAPHLADPHNTLGTIFGEQNRLDESEREYREAVNLDPRHAEAQSNYGASLARRGRYAEAREHFRDAARLKPGLISARLNFARALKVTNYSNEAILELRAILKLDPGNGEAGDMLEKMTKPQ